MDFLGLNRITKKLQTGTASQFSQIASIYSSFGITALMGTKLPWLIKQGNEHLLGMVIIIIIVGVTACYFINGKSSGKDFTLRFMSFYTTCFLIAVAPLVITNLIRMFFWTGLPELNNLSFISSNNLGLIFELLFFALMIWGFIKVAGKKLA